MEITETTSKRHNDQPATRQRDLIRYEEEQANNNKLQSVDFWSMSGLPQPAALGAGGGSGGDHHSKPSSSLFIVKSDDVSSIFDTRPRLPFLIQFNNNLDDERRSQVSMPTVRADDLEKPRPVEEMAAQRPGQSLPVDMMGLPNHPSGDSERRTEPVAIIDETPEGQPKEPDHPMEVSNAAQTSAPGIPMSADECSQKPTESGGSQPEVAVGQEVMTNASTNGSTMGNAMNPGYSSIGDSLIDLILKLKNENQELARALETNNRYVRERLVEIKKIHQLAQSNEKQFAMERLEYECEINKLKRQNKFLSDRLKSVETQKRGQSSRQQQGQQPDSQEAGDELLNAAMDRIYPIIDDQESFSNNSSHTRSSGDSSGGHHNDLATIQQLTDMPTNVVDGAPNSTMIYDRVQPTAPPMSVSSSSTTYAQQAPTYPKQVLYGSTDKQPTEQEQDPMKQCDKLEQQLNGIGKNDYEITLLQNQLNICRQDYRLERIAKLEAHLQIEKLKNDIDRLCLERLQQRTTTTPTLNEISSDDKGADHPYYHGHRRHKHFRRGHHRHHHHNEEGPPPTVNMGAGPVPPVGVIGKLGTHLSKKALKHAAKAAKKAQIHAAKMESEQSQAALRDQYASTRRVNPGSDMVNGLFSTANKAVLTGYKLASNMASARVNMALERLSQYDQTAGSTPPTNERPSDGSKR